MLLGCWDKNGVGKHTDNYGKIGRVKHRSPLLLPGHCLGWSLKKRVVLRFLPAVMCEGVSNGSGDRRLGASKQLLLG